MDGHSPSEARIRRGDSFNYLLDAHRVLRRQPFLVQEASDIRVTRRVDIDGKSRQSALPIRTNERIIDNRIISLRIELLVPDRRRRYRSLHRRNRMGIGKQRCLSLLPSALVGSRFPGSNCDPTSGQDLSSDDRSTELVKNLFHRKRLDRNGFLFGLFVFASLQSNDRESRCSQNWCIRPVGPSDLCEFGYRFYSLLRLNDFPDRLHPSFARFHERIICNSEVSFPGSLQICSLLAWSSLFLQWLLSERFILDGVLLSSRTITKLRRPQYHLRLSRVKDVLRGCRHALSPISVSEFSPATFTGPSLIFQSKPRMPI